MAELARHGLEGGARPDGSHCVGVAGVLHSVIGETLAEGILFAIFGEPDITLLSEKDGKVRVR